MSKRSAKSPLASTRVTRSKMDDTCNICKFVLNQKDTYVSCSKCSLDFHIGCAGVPERFYKHFIIEKCTPWYCHVCNVEIRNQTRKNTEDIAEILDKIDGVTYNVNAMNVQINSVKATHESALQVFEHEIMDKVNTHLTNFASSLSDKLASTTNNVPLSSSSNNPGRRKNIIIRGVPESTNEDVTAIVKKLAKALNFNDNNYIDNCFRLPSREQNIDNPGSIIMKFNTELARDSFLKCYFSFLKNHSLTPSHIGLAGNKRIFINEHMDPKLRLVLKEALLMRKNKLVTNVSTHCNHISVKTNEGWHRVHTLEELHNIQRIDDD